MSTILSSETTLKIRFNEVDALKIVWHGHYVNYFEDGRQAFGKQYKLGYLDVFHEGYTIPIVEFHVNHKSPLTFGNTAIVKTTYIPERAAKIRFEYEIYNAETKVLAANGYSVQVFLNAKSNELELYPPDFFLEWKKNHGIQH